MSHTPTPWRTLHYAQAIHEGYDGPVIKTDEDDPWVIAEVSRGIEGEPSEENAAFIVRACNAHEGLVEALCYALKCLDEVKKDQPLWHFYHYGTASVDEQARAALRKSQEEVPNER